MSWFLLAMRKYAVFSGRSRRKEYWYFVLFTLLIAVVLAAVDALLGGLGVLSGVFSLVVLVPSLAVASRRLHDSGKSGWWQLFGLVPLVGLVVVVVLLALDSQPGPNAHGPDPKGDAG